MHCHASLHYYDIDKQGLTDRCLRGKWTPRPSGTLLAAMRQVEQVDPLLMEDLRRGDQHFISLLYASLFNSCIHF